MSKVKSALGDVVDFEMMRIMEEFGGIKTNTATGTNAPVPVPVDPASLVIDNIPAQISILGSAEYVYDTVPVTANTVDTITEPTITIAQPETVDKSVKTAKKG